MFNILSQITLKVKFLRNEEQHCLLPSLVDDFTCVHSKDALLIHILSTLFSSTSVLFSCVQMGVRFLTVNQICFKHFVLLVLCVCVHNWSVSQWKQYELQIWSSWKNIIFSKWKVPWNSTPEKGHAHGEYFRYFHSCTWQIKTLPQSPICTEEIPLYTVHIKSIITKFCFWS